MLGLPRTDGPRWAFRLAGFQEQESSWAASGTLSAPLETGVAAAGSSGGFAQRLADVLAWDRDASRHPPRGNRSEVLVVEIGPKGEGSGRVGEVPWLRWLEASKRAPLEFLRSRENGYDGACRPSQRFLLRSPLPMLSVSSRFARHQLHLDLGVVRPHLGLDLLAPHGTPVRGTADGTGLLAG